MKDESMYTKFVSKVSCNSCTSVVGLQCTYGADFMGRGRARNEEMSTKKSSGLERIKNFLSSTRDCDAYVREMSPGEIMRFLMRSIEC